MRNNIVIIPDKSCQTPRVAQPVPPHLSEKLQTPTDNVCQIKNNKIMVINPACAEL